MSKDTIYRQDAIDAADRADYTGLAVEDVKKVTDEVVKEIKKLPSAQPEKRTEERTETHACDCIERQAAIRKLKRMATKAYIDKLNGSAETVINCCIDVIERQIPSAQPEIIRCKDCENWIPGYITDNDDFIPPKCGKYQQMVGHNSDDYCSLAERRTDE